MKHYFLFKRGRHLLVMLPLLILFLIGIVLASNCPDGIGYCNPNLPFLNSEPVTAVPSVNYSLVNVNNSLFWQGHTGTDGSWLTGILFNYNHTADVNTIWGRWFYNQTYSGSTYNSTYNSWAYNQSSDLTGYAKYQFTNNNFNGSGNWSGNSLTASSLTATRIPFASTGGLLVDDAGLTYNAATDLLTVTDSITISGGTATSDGFTLTGKITQTGITGGAGLDGSANILLTGTGGALTSATVYPSGAGGATTITTGAGGALTYTGTAGDTYGLTAGSGGALSLLGGVGGAITSSQTYDDEGGPFGGGGSTVTITSGAGGAATDVAGGGGYQATGGTGGVLIFTGGTGGFATGNKKVTGGTGGAFQLLGGAGQGITLGANNANGYGGAGGAFSLTSGGGATLTSTKTGGTHQGGAAGSFTLSAGVAGGTINGGAIAIGGAGGIFDLYASAGGNAQSGTTSNTGGAGGAVTIVAGAGGTGSGTGAVNGVGGAVTIVAGISGTTSKNGNILFKSGTTEIGRFDNTVTVGNFRLTLDNQKFQLGTAQDFIFTFTGTQGQIQSDAVTATDSLLLRGGTNGILFNISSSQIASINATIFNSAKIINTQQNFSVQGKQGLTKGVTIMKTAVTTCDINFTGGILTSTTC